jgi:hypothetical protein
MPSRSNPNVPTGQKRKAHRNKAQKANSKRVNMVGGGIVVKSGRISRNTQMAARPLSAKKARRLDKKEGYARRRALEQAMEEAGEVEMTGPLSREELK